jgi:hypothetical protein
MGRVQAGGWTDEEDLYGPPERAPTAAGSKKTTKKDKKRTAGSSAETTEDEAEEEDDDVTPVTVKQKAMRQTVVLYLEGLTAATYFSEGVVQSMFSFPNSPPLSLTCPLPQSSSLSSPRPSPPHSPSGPTSFPTPSAVSLLSAFVASEWPTRRS